MVTSYPFVPKSNAHLQPGDFWAIPLVDGSYACGRVLQLPPPGTPGGKVQFFGGLLDWHGHAMPDSASLAGARLAEQGVMHLHSITRIGGNVLGNRSLTDDGIVPDLAIHGTDILRGYDLVRPMRRGDLGVLPVWGWWGWNLIWLFANRRFLGLDLPADAEPAAA